MKKELIDAIESNDIITVRLIISNELLLNPKGDTYREMKEYAEANVPELYETHDGGSLYIDESNLSIDTLVQIKNNLDSNFSHERITVYENVAKIVLRKKKGSGRQVDYSMHKKYGKGNCINQLLGIGIITGFAAIAYGMYKGNILTTLAGATVATVSGAKLYNNKKNGK